LLETTAGPTLSEAEIYEITHYRRPAEQLRALAQLGIKASRRHDNTVCVLRVHYNHPPTVQEQSRPKLKLCNAQKA
jgi:hypothetical protein